MCLCLIRLSSTYTPTLLSFSPFNHPLVLQQSDIAIMSGASVLDGSIGFGPSELLLSFNLLGDYFEIKDKVNVMWKFLCLLVYKLCKYVFCLLRTITTSNI